jgi:DNA-binding response OmpR family regulator
MTIKVLVVDDEEDFAQILTNRLEFRNFEVTCAFSGDNALELIRKQDFDVVLLDVLMPGQSGLDTLKVHIIMLTGHARVDTAIQGMELGAYDYLIKPADIEELTEKIKLAHSHKASQTEKRALKKYAALLRLYSIETETASMMPATTTSMTITTQNPQKMMIKAARPLNSRGSVCIGEGELRWEVLAFFWLIMNRQPPTVFTMGCRIGAWRFEEPGAGHKPLQRSKRKISMSSCWT